MKRKIILILIIFLLFFIYILLKDPSSFKETERRAVFISYIDIKDSLFGKSKTNMYSIIDKMILDAKEYGFNMIILQVRSSSDAIYYSNIFPSSRFVVKNEGDSLPFDILKYFIKKSHKEGMELHTWINPYRVSTNTNVNLLSKSNPAYSMLNTSAVKIIDNKGIYYNPASDLVTSLILDGVKEIITNYDVDGIHFDDYFYPPSDNIDEIEFNKVSGITKNEFRLSTISSMIKKVYDLIKDYDENILFGISPDGNIDNNYNSNYVDTKLFCSKEGYIDYIMPQVYYGFSNSTKPFDITVKSWNDLITNNIDLIPALAFYKTGNYDLYAKDGANEWLTGDDIISREVLFSRNLSNYKGFAIFRFGSIFNGNLTEISKNEKKNLKKVLSF